MESSNRRRSNHSISGTSRFLQVGKTTTRLLRRNIAGSTSNLFSAIEGSRVAENNKLNIGRSKSHTRIGSTHITRGNTRNFDRMHSPRAEVKHFHSRHAKEDNDMNDKIGGTELTIERVRERSRGRSSSESSSSASEVTGSQPTITINGEEVFRKSKDNSKYNHTSGVSRKLLIKKGLKKMRSNIYSDKTMQAIEGKVMNAFKTGVSEGVSKGVGVPVDKFNDFVGMIGSVINSFGASDKRRHTVISTTNGVNITSKVDTPEQSKKKEEPKTASRAIFDWLFYIMDSGRMLHTTYRDKGLFAAGQIVAGKLFSVTTQGFGNGISYIRRHSV